MTTMCCGVYNLCRCQGLATTARRPGMGGGGTPLGSGVLVPVGLALHGWAGPFELFSSVASAEWGASGSRASPVSSCSCPPLTEAGKPSETSPPAQSLNPYIQASPLGTPAALSTLPSSPAVVNTSLYELKSLNSNKKLSKKHKKLIFKVHTF